MKSKNNENPTGITLALKSVENKKNMNRKHKKFNKYVKQKIRNQGLLQRTLRVRIDFQTPGTSFIAEFQAFFICL